MLPLFRLAGVPALFSSTLKRIVNRLAFVSVNVGWVFVRKRIVHRTIKRIIHRLPVMLALLLFLPSAV